MLHHRRQHGLDIVNHHMITSLEQRPSPCSRQKALTGPRRESRMPRTTDLHQIKDVVDQKLRAMLVGATVLQLLQCLRAEA